MKTDPFLLLLTFTPCPIFDEGPGRNPRDLISRKIHASFTPISCMNRSNDGILLEQEERKSAEKSINRILTPFSLLVLDGSLGVGVSSGPESPTCWGLWHRTPNKLRKRGFTPLPGGGEPPRPRISHRGRPSSPPTPAPRQG